uniref:Axonemal dynein light intermediate polypeptide 1 n=2 Tax=Nothobranchius kuhntae TaxID=321403 RepID=A0A1A8J7D0_NOTKU
MMHKPSDSLLKHDYPILVKTNENSPKGRFLSVSSPQSADTVPVPCPPRPEFAFNKSVIQWQENKEILNMIFPPRQWAEGSDLWVQQVSREPGSRADVVQLKKLLDTKLQQKQARQTGICPIRRELYAQCFDEIIRQVTINCAERGLLLLRVRDEINMTIAAYQTLYESSVAVGFRKALQSEQRKYQLKQKISDLENENEDLKIRLTDQKEKFGLTEESKTKKRLALCEEIQLLKKKNEDLKTQLVEIIAKQTQKPET